MKPILLAALSAGFLLAQTPSELKQLDVVAVDSISKTPTEN
jgi:hypothetical protein